MIQEQRNSRPSRHCRGGKLGSKSDDDDNGDRLSADEVTRYKRIAARANFFAQDRMDISFATKEATKIMTSPTKDDWNKLVWIGKTPRTTRRSTPGGCIPRGQHMLKFWSKMTAFFWCAKCANCFPAGSFAVGAPSAPAAEINEAAVVGLQSERSNVAEAAQRQVQYKCRNDEPCETGTGVSGRFDKDEYETHLQLERRS